MLNNYLKQYLIHRFLNKETSTIVRVKPTSDPETTFIAFTICPEFHSAYKKEKLGEYGINSSTDYRYGAVWYPKNNALSNNGRGIYRNITQELHEVIDTIEIVTQSLVTPKIVIDISTGLGRQYVKFSTKYSDTFGRCYTMMPLQDLLALEVTKITFINHIGVNIFLEHPGQHLHVNSRAKVLCKSYILVY